MCQRCIESSPIRRTIGDDDDDDDDYDDDGDDDDDNEDRGNWSPTAANESFKPNETTAMRVRMACTWNFRFKMLWQPCVPPQPHPGEISLRRVLRTRKGRDSLNSFHFSVLFLYTFVLSRCKSSKRKIRGVFS